VVAVGAGGFKILGKEYGLLRIFEHDGDRWEQLGQDIYGEAIWDSFVPWNQALAISADGHIVAAGAPLYDSPGRDDSGMAKVLHFNGTEWIPMGQKIIGDTVGEQLGYAIALSADGGVLAVSSVNHDGVKGVYTGGVRVFTYNESLDEWTQVGPIV